MGSAVGGAYAGGGARVVTTLDGRSRRTRRFAAAAALEVLDLDAVVRQADIVLSIVPPEHALGVAENIAAAARRVDSRPLVTDLNAIAPGTARQIALRLADIGLDLVDGSMPVGRHRQTAHHSAGFRSLAGTSCVI
jgi:3-hydroxyisobutyrate dehydrogenase-like beta-hydroxyacid dehydrogenase